jgi:regulator of RNase E activity RraA
VKVFPGDNLMVHKAFDIAEPGEVIVMDAQGSTMTAVLRGLLSTKARHRASRDSWWTGWRATYKNFWPWVICRFSLVAITPIGPLQRGPGEINHPVCAGGVVIGPGDVVVGDRNGVVAVPRNAAEDVLTRLRAKAAREAAYVATVPAGNFSNSWVDRLLRAGGVVFPDDEMVEARDPEPQGTTAPHADEGLQAGAPAR